MAFYRFETLESHHFNPHLTSTTGPVIEGAFMYFRRVKKPAGGKSRLHYHPNEFMAFLLEGTIDAVVGSGRQSVRPGTLVHIPSNVQHSFKPDEDINYLYIKDRTWTLIGAAADEALPDRARSATEVANDIKGGTYPGGPKAPEKSQAIVESVGDCFHSMIDGLNAPYASGHCERWLRGVNLEFGFIESCDDHETSEKTAAHEAFVYIISGSLEARVGGDAHTMNPGDVLHVPRGTAYGWVNRGQVPARYTVVRSTPRLEEEVARNGASDNWRG